MRADDSGTGITTLYSYDERGNLLAKNEYAYTRETPGTLQNSVTLSYASSDWLDQLTNVNGKALTYDKIGNVLTYGDRMFTWDNVRQLKSIKGDGLDVRYTYDALGKLMATTICKAVTMTPNIGRFINSDSYEILCDLKDNAYSINAYRYCL